MKVYSFGAEHAPVILLLPGTCCHWKGNFGRVIHEQDLQHEELLACYPERWAQLVKSIIGGKSNETSAL